MQLAFDKTNGKFKDYFETMMLDHQKQMASIGQETNARFLQNNKDIEKYIDGQLLVLRDNLLNERLKQDTIMEGKAQQYTIEIESRVMHKVSQMLDDSTKMREEILGKLQMLNSEVAGNINTELNKEDKILMETKLTVRDAALKQWTMDLLDQQHKEWSRMYDEKLEVQKDKVTGKRAASKIGTDDKGKARDSYDIDQIEIFKNELKEEVIQLFEDDRRLRNVRFNEVYNLIESNK